jgi:hypothetical protein
MPTSSVKPLLKVPTDEQPTAKRTSVTLRSPRMGAQAGLSRDLIRAQGEKLVDFGHGVLFGHRIGYADGQHGVVGTAGQLADVAREALHVARLEVQLAECRQHAV